MQTKVDAQQVKKMISDIIKELYMAANLIEDTRSKTQKAFAQEGGRILIINK